MLRILFTLLISLHGVIHLMGFIKAFRLPGLSGINSSISKSAGIFWLVSTILFLLAALLYVLKKEGWWLPAIMAVCLSQVLIFTLWKEARFGTALNVLILVISILDLGSWKFERSFTKDVAAQFSRPSKARELVTEKDLLHLPLSVQQYLRISGVVNQPRVHSMRLVFKGKMRDKGKDWFDFTSEQYSFFDEPARHFFIRASIRGMRVPGYHVYRNGKATMDVRISGLFPVVYAEGVEMDRAETVTHFNDMCLFAPATLIDTNIQWKEVDAHTVDALFKVGEISIRARLYFNEAFQLVNFESFDRYDIGAKKQYRFTTPVGEHSDFHGFDLPAYGEAVWHYPDGPFAYGQFHTIDINYNPERYRGSQ